MEKVEVVTKNGLLLRTARLETRANPRLLNVTQFYERA
jgi:hypothetical protein